MLVLELQLQTEITYSIVSCRKVEKNFSADICVLEPLFDVLRKTINLVHCRAPAAKPRLLVT